MYRTSISSSSGLEGGRSESPIGPYGGRLKFSSCLVFGARGRSSSGSVVNGLYQEYNARLLNYSVLLCPDI